MQLLKDGLVNLPSQGPFWVGRKESCRNMQKSKHPEKVAAGSPPHMCARMHRHPHTRGHNHTPPVSTSKGKVLTLEGRHPLFISCNCVVEDLQHESPGPLLNCLAQLRTDHRPHLERRREAVSESHNAPSCWRSSR